MRSMGTAILWIVALMGGITAAIGIVFIALRDNDWFEARTRPDDATRPSVPDAALPILGAGTRQLKRPRIEQTEPLPDVPEKASRTARVRELIRLTQSRY